MWSSGHHTGLDFPAATGTPVRAVDAGQVVGAASGGPYGNHLILNHGGGLSSLYAHLSRMVASIGDAVTRGQVIGTVGATGNVTSPHLHLEARQNGWTIDPMAYLYDDGGWLLPGLGLVENKTGKPEAVLTSEQWNGIGAFYARSRAAAQGTAQISQQWESIRTTALTAKSATPNVQVDVHITTTLDGRELKGVVIEQINIYDRESATDLSNGRYV
jgi:hypothetical protein